MKKKSIYYLLSNYPTLQPISGNRITELSIIKCLSLNYDVYYNNQLVDFSKPNLGLNKKTIETPKKNYDYYWVRTNDNILLKCPGFKIRCGAPYNKFAYRKCDIIVTYTKSWEEKLLDYNINPKPSDGLYPDNKIPIPKNVITVYQSIDKRFYEKIDQNMRNKMRKNLTGQNNVDLLIAHFGRVSKTCYPKHLLQAFNKLCDNYPNKNLKLAYVGKKIHFRIPIKSKNKNVIVNTNGINYHQIHKYIQSVDLITSDYNTPTADWGGCMHIIEAMACGVPILCGNYDVRIEQMGEDYPLFWNKNGTRDEIVDRIYSILVNLLEKQIDLETLSKNLIESSKKYQTEVIAKKIYEDLENITNNN